MSISYAEKYTEKPDKNMYSHPHDALQYAATMLIGPMIMDPWSDEDDKIQEMGFYRVDNATASQTTGY